MPHRSRLLEAATEQRIMRLETWSIPTGRRIVRQPCRGSDSIRRSCREAYSPHQLAAMPTLRSARTRANRHEDAQKRLSDKFVVRASPLRRGQSPQMFLTYGRARVAAFSRGLWTVPDATAWKCTGSAAGPLPCLFPLDAL